MCLCHPHFGHFTHALLFLMVIISILFIWHTCKMLCKNLVEYKKGSPVPILLNPTIITTALLKAHHHLLLLFLFLPFLLAFLPLDWLTFPPPLLLLFIFPLCVCVFVFCYTIINKNHHHHVRLIHTQLLTCKSISACKNNPWCWRVLVFYLCFDFLLSSLSLFQSFDWFFSSFFFS